MAFPKLVPQEVIDRIKKDEQTHREHLESIGYDPALSQVEMQQARDRKERFLELLSQCMSPKLASKQLGISIRTYRKWRSTDSWFCEELNRIIQDWRGELLTSSMARAIGYVRKDPETGEFETDGEGKIIRHGASDRLAIALLNAEQRDQEQNTNVNINLNLNALGIVDGEIVDGKIVAKEPPALKQLPSNVVEGKFTEKEPVETEPDSDPEQG